MVTFDDLRNLELPSGMNVQEIFALLLALMSAGIDVDTSEREVGLLTTMVTYNGTTTEVDNEEDVLFTGQVTALVLLFGMFWAFQAAMQIFLVGTGNLSARKGHMLALKFQGLAGLALLGACGFYSFFFPSEFEYHENNSDSAVITINGQTITYTWQLKSVDHYYDSFMGSIIGSLFSFMSAVSLYFARNRMDLF